MTDTPSGSSSVTERDEILRQLEQLREQLDAAEAEMLAAGQSMWDAGNFRWASGVVADTLASLIGGAPQTGWQPISTAPKDGTLVLAFRGRSQSGVPGCYARVTRFNGREWLSIPGRYSWAPTHWQPLPDPPGEIPEP